MRQGSGALSSHAQVRRVFVAARMRRILRDSTTTRGGVKQLLALAAEDDVADDVVHTAMAERCHASVERADDDWDGAA
jgi:hypothetical protein